MGALRTALLLLCALLALAAAAAAAAPTEDPAAACPRGCRCFAVGGAEGEAAANCSSPAAALALGARLRVLRLSRYDDHLSVKEGAFRALAGLRELHLDRLGLVKVYPGAFRGLTQLETLDLSHNALSAGDELSRALRDLPALRRLSLRGNNFGAAHGVAPALASRTLKFVDLGRCKLRDLPPTVFAGLTHVRHIVLDGNFIREFVAAAFPRSVVSLDLSHNDIDRISRAELIKLENVDSIELAENPIHCTCELLKISFEYNMNKAVVCAYPKQLMGKDLLKIKKHQVCAGHKKIKREAGNELDDEALSAEELDNGEDLVNNPLEENPEEADGAVNNPVDEADPEDTDGAANSAVNEEEEEQTPNLTLENLDNEPNGPAVENAGDYGQSEDADEAEPETPVDATSAEEKNEPAEDHVGDSGPEDIDGDGEEEKSPKETENVAWEDEVNEEEGEVVDHAAVHTKSDTPPDEADETEEEPEEAPKPSAEEEVEEPADDNENVENTHVGAAIRNDDVENEDDEDKNAQETSNVGNVVATDNVEEEETPAESDEEAVEEDPPEILPASAYNHMKTEDENVSQEKETDGENEAENNEETVREEAPVDPEIEDYSAPQVDLPKEELDNTDEEAETGDAVIPDAPNAGNEELKENPEQAASAEEENTAEHTHANPDAAAEPDSIHDDDVEEADTDTSQGVPIVGEGARMETAPKTEDADNTDVDALDDEDDEADTQNEDEGTPNAVNNEDDILSAVVHSKKTENEAEPGEGNSDEAGNTGGGAGEEETDDDVENVPDNDNVVHSSGVGARVESEDNPEVDDADADEETDDAENDAGSILTAGENIENENEQEGEVHEPNTDDAEGNTDVDGNTGVDTVENEAEENPDDENEDAKNSDVLVAAGLGDDSEEEEDEKIEENEDLGTGLVDAVVGTKNTEEEKTLEEELKEDRAHATLGHEDIDEETTDEEHANAAKNESTEENAPDEDDDEEPILIPPQISDKQNENDNFDTEDELERDNDIVNENQNTHTGHTHIVGVDDADDGEPKEYEEVIERGEQVDKSPGGALLLAPTDNEDNEEEGSGNVLHAVEETPLHPRKNEDDWAEDTETVNENENEAVPPLGNADSKEVTGTSGEREDDTAPVDPSEEPPLVFAAVDDATEEEEETGSGAGVVVPGSVPLDRGDEEPASNEEDEGSGQAVPFGHVPAIPAHDTDKEDDEDEEGSGKGVFIPVLPGLDRIEDETDAEVEDGVDDMVDIDKATTVAPVVAPEDEIIPRVHIPPQAAPPNMREEEPLPPVEEEEPSEPEEEDVLQGGAVAPEEDPQGRDRSDSGRSLVPPEQPADADEDDAAAAAPDQTANAAEDGDLNVEVVPGMDDTKKGNIAEADGDRADGSEALNKDDAISMNTIASYVVLGAIMVIVVFLLGYAVCRSRRQKSPSARDKDPENPDRELHEVNKPLINNHHPSAEKQPLDETQQPLMTKEQEASLTIDPDKKPLTEDTTDAANHKPKQNGIVPEVVVEKQAAPMVNGKAASPAAERAPSPAAPAPAPSPTAAAPPPTTPTAPAASPAASPAADGHAANGNALPLVNGGSVSPGAAPPLASSPAAAAPPVSPGAVRVVAKELPDSVAKRPVIIMNRGADPQQQV